MLVTLWHWAVGIPMRTLPCRAGEEARGKGGQRWRNNEVPAGIQSPMAHAEIVADGSRERAFAEKLGEGGEPLGSALPVHVKGGSDLARSLSLLPHPFIHY